LRCSTLLLYILDSTFVPNVWTSSGRPLAIIHCAKRNAMPVHSANPALKNRFRNQHSGKISTECFKISAFSKTYLPWSVHGFTVGFGFGFVSSVCKIIEWGLIDRGSIPCWGRNFPLCHQIQSDTGYQPLSCPMCIGSSALGWIGA
jgi:hypothetical protein